jgi:recombinase-like zinc beta ribbon protein
VQQITALAVPQDGRAHRYQLTGLLVCGLCGRRLQGHWVNHRPGYRCRHGHTTAHLTDTDGPRWVYWAQARIVEEILAAGNRDLADLANAGQLAAHLRARDALIVCSPNTVVLEGPPPEDTETEIRPTDEMQGSGQLVLPMPNRVAPGLSLQESSTWSADPKLEPRNTKPPTRST